MTHNEERTTWSSHVKVAFIAHTLFAIASTLLTISKVLEVASAGRIDELNGEEKKFIGLTIILPQIILVGKMRNEILL